MQPRMWETLGPISRRDVASTRHGGAHFSTAWEVLGIQQKAHIYDYLTCPKLAWDSWNTVSTITIVAIITKDPGFALFSFRRQTV